MSALECAICLAFSSSEGDYFVNTQCGHIYHFSCIKRWIDESLQATCPKCRESISFSSLVKLHGIKTTLSAENPNNNCKYKVNLALLGEMGTGKSSLLRSFTDEVFLPYLNTTVACDICSKVVDFSGEKIKLIVCDCQGQDRFRTIIPNFLRNINGVIIVYDTAELKTFKCINDWLQIVNDHAPTNVSIMLVGNKADLENFRQVPIKLGQSKAKELGIQFLETSAKDLTNVEAVFRTLVGTILQDLSNSGQIDSIKIKKDVTLSLTDSNAFSKQSDGKCKC